MTKRFATMFVVVISVIGIFTAWLNAQGSRSQQCFTPSVTLQLNSQRTSFEPEGVFAAFRRHANSRQLQTLDGVVGHCGRPSRYFDHRSVYKRLALYINLRCLGQCRDKAVQCEKACENSENWFDCTTECSVLEEECRASCVIGD